MEANGSTDPAVSVATEIRDGRTVLTVTGTRELAVVVDSASGERVYLPPEAVDDGSTDNPYEGTEGTSPYEGVEGTSPYEGVEGTSPYEGVPDESPYGSARAGRDELGVTPTADGFRVVHPEPATDVRFLR